MSRRNKSRPSGAQVNTEAVSVQDAFANPLFRLGYGSQSPLEATEYPLTRMTDNYALLNSLYRDNWVVQNVVGLMVDDMLREWYKPKGDITPEMQSALSRDERDTCIRDRINEGVRWGRLYGGAAGGGKSDALVIEALRQVDIPHYRALILRKTYPQLSDLVDKSQMYYRRAFPQAQYNATAHVWNFPSGAKIYFGSMQYTKDRTNYQGKAYDFIGFDELTHFEWEEYSYMMSRNRPTGPGTRVYMRATTNPGGIGHGWVKARFITPAPPGTPIVEEYTVRRPDGTEQKLQRARVFIPSSIFDNPALLQNDPGYLASLAAMPEAEKQALLYGSWDSFSGQVFTEWRNDPAHYQDQRWTHVIAPFAIPKHWQIYRGFDFGFSKPFSVGWYAADEEGRLYRIKELYGCTGRPNEGLRIDPVEQARRIREAEQNDPVLRGRVIHGVADPAIFDESRGESIAAMMERSPNFLHWKPGDHTRLAGKMQFHYRLNFDADGRPMLQVFNTCKHFIRTLPNLVYDESNVEDIDTRQEDHIYDECRYVLMENPISPPARRTALPPPDDPLDLHRQARFYRI